MITGRRNNTAILVYFCDPEQGKEWGGGLGVGAHGACRRPGPRPLLTRREYVVYDPGKPRPAWAWAYAPGGNRPGAAPGPCVSAGLMALTRFGGAGSSGSVPPK